MRSLNLNVNVRVKPTRHGEKTEEQWVRKLFPFGSHGSILHVPDKDGYTKWELWELMNVFGPEMYNGNPEMCFVDNEIQICEEPL
jgi:hypothetical protein